MWTDYLEFQAILDYHKFAVQPQSLLIDGNKHSIGYQGGIQQDQEGGNGPLNLDVGVDDTNKIIILKVLPDTCL